MVQLRNDVVIGCVSQGISDDKYIRTLQYLNAIQSMRQYPRALITVGLILGAIAWVTIHIFLPMLMWGEASTGKSNHALFFVLTGPALIFPWTLLGVWHPRISSRLFLLSANVNLVAMILWIQPQGHYETRWDIHEMFGLLVSVALPGPLLLLLFAFLFSRVKSPAYPG